MAVFRPNETIVTSEPIIIVNAGLPLGRHAFQLVVEDQDGLTSLPTVVHVKVVQQERRSRARHGPAQPG